MIEAYRADANGRFWALLNRAPTSAELSIITDAWPNTSWDGIDARIRAFGAAPAPSVPAPAAPPAKLPWLWVFVVLGLVVAFVVIKRLRK